ncbi:MAG: leucine-rich repeat domain-containing protein [Synergistaceae bacterium]|nr:leucine-rich repeat domain-containing protein [Synergistaceae bacterium]
MEIDAALLNDRTPVSIDYAAGDTITITGDESLEAAGFARIKALNGQNKPFHLVLNNATQEIPRKAPGDSKFFTWAPNIENITNVTLLSISGPGVQEIDKFALRECTVLKSISFPVAGIIGPYAFEACPFLENVHLPSVSTIEYEGSCARFLPAPPDSV